jgi:neutral ceramidase
MRAGFAQADITPGEPLTLSGFIFRMNRPAAGVDDALFIRALALEGTPGDVLLILVFDLLGLGPELTERITQRVSRAGVRLCLVCTHTHSAPATVHLQGCGVPSPAYWEQVAQAAARAAEAALADLRGPVRLEWEVRHVPVVSYHRRKLLADGRVVMTRRPDAPVVREGEVDDTLFLGRLVLADGTLVAGLAHFHAHPCTVCTDRVTADYPGVLCADLSAYFGAPFLFLPGACGDINPACDEMDRPAMLANVARMMDVLRSGQAAAAGTEDGPVCHRAAAVVLRYQALPSTGEMRAEVAALERIAAGEATGPEAVAGLARLGNILNTRPGEPVDITRASYAAEAMVASRRQALAAAIAGTAPEACALSVTALRVGSILFPVLAAEVFVDTHRRLQQAFPAAVVRTVGYGSPLCGYLPTAQALAEGGYEAADSYVFYGHPAPFAPEAESVAIARTEALMEECCTA